MHLPLQLLLLVVPLLLKLGYLIYGTWMLPRNVDVTHRCVTSTFLGETTFIRIFTLSTYVQSSKVIKFAFSKMQKSSRFDSSMMLENDQSNSHLNALNICCWIAVFSRLLQMERNKATWKLIEEKIAAGQTSALTNEMIRDFPFENTGNEFNYPPWLDMLQLKNILPILGFIVFFRLIAAYVKKNFWMDAKGFR